VGCEDDEGVVRGGGVIEMGVPLIPHTQILWDLGSFMNNCV
jgi:hypothetical protein